MTNEIMAFRHRAKQYVSNPKQCGAKNQGHNDKYWP